MVERSSYAGRIFLVCNYIGLAGLALLCVLPLLHILAVSFSARTPAEAGLVKLWPIGFNTSAYEYALMKVEFIRSFWKSVERVALGLLVNIPLIVLTAYPLSKEASAFRPRTAYVWIFFFTILFGGGLIPTYMVIQETGLLNTIWALVIPTAVPVFSVVLLLHFFRGLPRELEESAHIDGAGHVTVAWRIYVPLSVPALATLSLFSIVGHWNAWFDGIIYMHSSANYPLQSYLKTLVIDENILMMAADQDADLLEKISGRQFRSAQIFLGMIPILLVYPFLQKYFVKGIVLGSVKG